MLRDFPIAFARLRDKKTSIAFFIKKNKVFCLFFQDLFFERKTGMKFIC